MRKKRLAALFLLLGVFGTICLRAQTVKVDAPQQKTEKVVPVAAEKNNLTPTRHEPTPANVEKTVHPEAKIVPEATRSNQVGGGKVSKPDEKSGQQPAMAPMTGEGKSNPAEPK